MLEIKKTGCEYTTAHHCYEQWLIDGKRIHEANEKKGGPRKKIIKSNSREKRTSLTWKRNVWKGKLPVNCEWKEGKGSLSRILQSWHSQSCEESWKWWSVVAWHFVLAWWWWWWKTWWRSWPKTDTAKSSVNRALRKDRYWELCTTTYQKLPNLQN